MDILSVLSCIAVIVLGVVFSVDVIRSAWRKYVGYNPTAPSLWTRISKAFFDPHPEQDESHSSTRYDR